MRDQRRSTTGKRTVAGVAAAAFLFTSVGEPFAQSTFWAERQAARVGGAVGTPSSLLSKIEWPKESLHPLLGRYRMPADAGVVVETHVATAAGKPSPVLLHLQDAHGLYGAQWNASKILRDLSRLPEWRAAPGGMPVYQEGGVGPARVEWLSAFPFEDIREEVSKAHLRRGDVTGEEYRGVVEPYGAIRLVGVETDTLYRKNLSARHDTADARAQADKAIAAVQGRLAAIKGKVYSEALKRLDRPVQDFAAGKISFVQYAQSLTALAPGRLSPKATPQLDTFLRLMRLEHDMDPRAFSDERAILVQKIAPRLSAAEAEGLAAKAVALRQSSLTPRAFYEHLLALTDALKREGVDLPTRHLRTYVGYLKLTESLQHESLLAETERFKNRLLESQAQNDRVWRLMDLDRRVTLERLLWRQEMTPDQYAAFRREGGLHWNEVNNTLSAQEKELGLISPAAASGMEWTRSLARVRDYYELALERDIALVRNALADMERTGASRGVLIAGGFHTPGITRLLRQSGANYAVVQPRFDGDMALGSDLTITRAPDVLHHSVRESNRLTNAIGIQPLGQNLPVQMLAEMFTLATGKVLSAPKEDAARNEQLLGAYKAFLNKQQGEDVPLELHRVAYFKDAHGEAPQVLLFGEFKGALFILASDLKTNKISWVSSDILQTGDQINLNSKFTSLLKNQPALQGLWNDLIQSLKKFQGAEGSENQLSALRQTALQQWDAFSQAAGFHEVASQFHQLAQAAVATPIFPRRDVERGEASVANVRRAALTSVPRAWSQSVRFWPTVRKVALGVLLFMVAPVAMAGEAAGLSIGLSPWTALSVFGGFSVLGWAGLTVTRSKAWGPRFRSYIVILALTFSTLLAPWMIQSTEAAQLSADGAYYTVEVKDTVWSMARQDLLKAGATVTNKDIANRVADYAKANPGVNLENITRGQKIERPKQSQVSAVDHHQSSALVAPTESPITSLDGQMGVEASIVVSPEVIAPPLSENTGSQANLFENTTSPAQPSDEETAGLVEDEPGEVPSPNEEMSPAQGFAEFLQSVQSTITLPFASAASAVHNWFMAVSFSNWLIPVFALVGLGGAFRFWRGRSTPEDQVQWAERLADQMANELKKGPRTVPKSWNISVLRWRRNMLSAEDQSRVDAEPSPWKRWMLRNYLLLKQGEFPRYNTYGAHGRYLSFVGLSEIKRVSSLAEKGDGDLSKLKKELKDVDALIKKLAFDRQTSTQNDLRAAFAQLNRRRDELELAIVNRRTALQRPFVDALHRALLERKTGVLDEGVDALRQQREVMWRTFEGAYDYYQNRLVPEGFELKTRARLFLTLTTIGYLTFTGVFLSQVFFFPSMALTALSWILLGPLLFNISRSFVDPLVIMAFMMGGAPPEGHARRDFLEAVREHAQKVGRPYAFSVEVPKMSGNPLDGFLKTDIGAAYFKTANGLSTSFDLTPAQPSATLQFPQILDENAQGKFARFIQDKLWEGFKLDVAVSFESARARDGSEMANTMVARLRPSPGVAGQRFESRVNEILARAGGVPQRLFNEGIRIVDGEWIEVDVFENYTNPDNVGYPATVPEVTGAEERTWSRLDKMIEGEYKLPLSLSVDREPNIAVRFDRIGENVVRRVVYRFGVPTAYRNEIPQNLDPTTRFLDTIHLEADVWAAYREVDIENLRQTLRDTTAQEFVLSFAMPTNTNIPYLIQYELENLRRLQAEMDTEFPGRVSFVYFNQAMEWSDKFESGEKMKDVWVEEDPIKKLGDRFTLFKSDGTRLYMTVQGDRVVVARSNAMGHRNVETLLRNEATSLLKQLNSDDVRRVVRWNRGGWGKKLGNVAGMEWLKAGYTRPPAYNDIDNHEHFTNPDAPLFPNAAAISGDILGYFRNDVVVHRADGTSIRFAGSTKDLNQVVMTSVDGEQSTLSREAANRELAKGIADFHTDRLTDSHGHPLEPDDLSVVMDDKNSILSGAVEAAIGVAEHPANQGVVGFNPVIEVDPPRNTRGGMPGSYFSSILLDYLDKSRVIHNMYDARFKAGLFGNMSAMYGKIFKRTSYGDSFTDERITVARALSHDWQESQFSPTEAVYGDVAFTFQLMDTTRDKSTRTATQVYRVQRGSRFELIRLVMSSASSDSKEIDVAVERLNGQGEWVFWRKFSGLKDEDVKPLVRRISTFMTNAIGVRERDLLTLGGVVDRDFRWLRGDLQMQSTAKSYAADALPHAHRYHLAGINFRLNGDPSFLVVLLALIPLWLFPEQALLVNKTLAYVLFGITMLGVAFRGHFLYPAYFDAMSRVQILTVSPWLGKPLFWGLLVVFGVKNFFLSLLTISATTLMSLPIAFKRTFYLETTAKIIEFIKNVPSVWVTSSATVVRELNGAGIGDTWKNEVSLLNLVVFGAISFVAFIGLAYTGNVFFGALFPLGVSIIVASMLTGWIVAHFAGQAYRRNDRMAKLKRWLQVYGLSALIAGIIFITPVTNFLTDKKIEQLRTPPPAETLLRNLANPATQPRSIVGVDVAGIAALQVQPTKPPSTEPAPRIKQAADHVGAGQKPEILEGIPTPLLTGRKDLSEPLPIVRTQAYSKTPFKAPQPLESLRKPELTEDQVQRLIFLLSQLDRMGSDKVRWQNIAIYAGGGAIATFVPFGAVALKGVDVVVYIRMLAANYPWLKEPMVAKYWAQTALLMDLNDRGDGSTHDTQVRSVKDIAHLLLWDKIKELWDVDYAQFLQEGMTLKNPKDGSTLISEQDYRDLAQKATLSMDQYEVLSTAVINLHYGLGYPLEKITPELVWRFTRLSYEIEKAWEVAVPSVEIKPVQLFPRPAAKFLRVIGNFTFFVPVHIPIISDAHIEMIPMATAFIQKPGGLQEFMTQMLEHNEKKLEEPGSEEYINKFLELIGADYIEQFSDPAQFPADTALFDLVQNRMTEDMKKYKKTPSEKDLRLAYLQTEYNLGRIALFNRTKAQSKDMAEIRAAGLAVAHELAEIQKVAQSLAPDLYGSHMKLEPGALEVEGLMLYLLHDNPTHQSEYWRVLQDVLKTSESILQDMSKNGWTLSENYRQHVLSLLPTDLVADMSPMAKEYNVLRDLALLHLNMQKNAIVKADGKTHTYKETMEALLAVKDRVDGFRLPQKPGILATVLLHSLKMKSEHPDVTEAHYWEENLLPTLRSWADWSASPDVFKKIESNPHWGWYRNRINGEIEAEMGTTISDPDVRQFNAIQSMAQLVNSIYYAFPSLQSAHKESPARVADLIITLAHRTESYQKFFETLKNLPSDATGFQQYFITAGFELNGMQKPFDPAKGFDAEVESFLLRPVNDLWNSGVYESLPKSFVEAIRSRIKDTQVKMGFGNRPIKDEDLKTQTLQAFYRMTTSALYSAQAPKALPPYSPVFLKEVVQTGRELVSHAAKISGLAADLPRVNDYLLKEPGILENEAIQVYLLQKKAGAQFKLENYFAFTRIIFQKANDILKDQPSLLKLKTFGQFRAAKSNLLSEQAFKRMSERGRDFLALRSLANLIINAEANDMRPGASLAARALSPEGWMAAYLDTWDHFENAPKYGGKKYQHVPYREEGFVDMIALLKQKWGFNQFWEKYYYERLNQVESFMTDPAFVQFIRSTGDGKNLLTVINEDIFRKSGLQFAPDHPIYTFNGVIGLTEMFIDAEKKFPGAAVDFKLIASRYLRYYDLFYKPDPATGQVRYPHLPYQEEGFVESLVTGGYNFEANGGLFEDELRIMKLNDVNALMGAKALDRDEKFQGTFVRAHLEEIIRTESAVPPGVTPPVIDFFILQKIVGLGQTYNMLTGPSTGIGQPLSVNVAQDLPVLKSAMRALVYVHSGIRQKTADGKDVYPKLRPIFDILGESEKWVGRMYATGLMTENRFPEIFTNYINLLDRHFAELKGTFLPPEQQGESGARYLGELGSYIRVLKENLRKDAATIEARFVTRGQRERRLGLTAELEKEKVDGLEEETRARIVFVRPDIDESQFILDSGYIITEILRDMDREIGASKTPSLADVSVDRMMGYYFKSVAHLKTRHYKGQIMQIQSYRDSEALGRLNAKINNYAMRFAFIDHLVFSSHADPQIQAYAASIGLTSVEQFIDFFYENLRVVQTTDGLRQALDELRNANEFSAEGVEFSYAMMLTLNHHITKETLQSVAAHIPRVLRDYEDFLLKSTSGQKTEHLKFRVDSPVVLYEALSRELALIRPLGDTGARMEVKQKRTNQPWMVDALVKAVYGNLFGIYLDDENPEDKKLLKDWEMKAFGKDFGNMVRELAAQPTVMGQKNAYLDEISKVDDSIRKLTVKYETAKRDLRESLAEDYQVQIRILKQIRSSLDERMGYLVMLAETMNRTNTSGVEEKNQATMEILLLLALIGLGTGAVGFARGWKPLSARAKGLVGWKALEADLAELNARRKQTPLLNNTALAVYLGLPVMYGLYFGMGGGPRLYQDTRSIVTQPSYEFQVSRADAGVIFADGGFSVLQQEEQRNGQPVFLHKIMRNGYLVGRIDLAAGSAEFVPGPVPATNGLSYPLNPGPSLVMVGYGEIKPDGTKAYSYEGHLKNVSYRLDKNGDLLLSGSLLDGGGAFEAKNYQMAITVAEGATRVSVSGDFTARQALRLSEFNIGSLNTQSEIGVPQGNPSPFDLSLSLEAQGAKAGDRVYLYFGNDHELPSSGLTPWSVQWVSLGGTAYNNTPNVRIVPQSVTMNGETLDPVAAYTLLPNQLDQQNVAIAPVVGGGEPLTLPAGGQIKVHYIVEITPVVVKNSIPLGAPEQKPFSLWQTGMAFLLFGAASFFGFDAASFGSAGQMVFGGFLGVMGSWGSLFYGRHLTLGLAAVALRNPSNPALDLKGLASRFGLSKLQATEILPAGVFAKIDPSTGRGSIAIWLVSPWARFDGVRRHLLSLVLAHEAQRFRLRRFNLLQTPVLYLIKPFQSAWNRLTEKLRSTWTDLTRWAQWGSGLFAYGTNAVLKGFPAAPAMMVAAPVKIFGGVSPFGRVMSLPHGLTLWTLPRPISGLLRPGGFLVAPPGAESYKGDGLVVSLPEGKLSPAVGRALLQFLSGIAQRLEVDGGKAPIHVELILGVEAPSLAQQDRVKKAFQYLAQSGGVPKSLLDHLTVNVSSRNPAVLKARLTQLAPTTNLNVLASDGEASFWFTLGVPLRLFAVRLLDKLTQVEVDIVFSGEEAQALMAMDSTLQADNQGRVKMKALQAPLEVLEGDVEKIEVFNQQA